MLYRLALALVFIMSNVWFAYSAGQGTPEEAQAMVKKAIDYIKANGKEKAFAEISKPDGMFKDRDLYVMVYDMDGKCLAHGANSKMIGKSLIDLKDPDGKYFVRERIEIAKKDGQGWQDYKFMNPETKKIEPKKAYLERLEDMIVLCGAYAK